MAMSAGYELPAHSAMVRKETIGNTIATVVIAAGLSWAIFAGKSSIEPLRPPGGIFGIFPGTFNFTFLVTLALTLITRRRVRSGLLARLAAAGDVHRGARLPANLALRAVVLAAVATLTLVPIGVGLTWAGLRSGILPAQWSFAGILVFFVVYFAVLSWVVTPIILWRALGD